MYSDNNLEFEKVRLLNERHRMERKRQQEPIVPPKRNMRRHIAKLRESTPGLGMDLGMEQEQEQRQHEALQVPLDRESRRKIQERIAEEKQKERRVEEQQKRAVAASAYFDDDEEASDEDDPGSAGEEEGIFLEGDVPVQSLAHGMYGDAFARKAESPNVHVRGMKRNMQSRAMRQLSNRKALGQQDPWEEREEELKKRHAEIRRRENERFGVTAGARHAPMQRAKPVHRASAQLDYSSDSSSQEV